MSHLAHLVRRFFGSLLARPLRSSERAWVEARLSPAEFRLWNRYSKADQRHTFIVAKRVDAEFDSEERAAVAAALLHDIGKTQCRLGTFGRSFATVAMYSLGRKRVIGWSDSRVSLLSQFGRYVDHPRLGGALLRQAGSVELAALWAEQHHLPEKLWTVDPSMGHILQNADDA